MTGEGLWIGLPAGEVLYPEGGQDMDHEHDKHKGMPRYHGRGWSVETGPHPSSIERMVRDEPLIGYHGDPGVLFHAPADEEHAFPVVKGEMCDLVPVRPEMVEHGEVELNMPGVVHGNAREKGIETSTCTNIQSVVQEVWTHTDSNIQMVGVDKMMVLNIEVTMLEEELHRLLSHSWPRVCTEH